MANLTDLSSPESTCSNNNLMFNNSLEIIRSIWIALKFSTNAQFVTDTVVMKCMSPVTLVFHTIVT